MKLEERLIPDCWEDLTKKQFSYFLHNFIYKLLPGKCSKDQFLDDYSDYCIGRPRSLMADRIAHIRLVTAEIAASMGLWLLTEESGQLAVNFNSTENLLPEIGKLKGPLSHGADLRFGEFREAVRQMNDYTTGHDEASLNCLVGILYRHPSGNVKAKDFDGNFREKYNPNRLEHYERIGSHIPAHLKYGVYLWFSYFCQYLMSGVFFLDGCEICFADIFGESGEDEEQADNSIGMKSILFTLADQGTFGNAADTDQQLLFDILQKLMHDKNTLDQINSNNTQEP